MKRRRTQRTLLALACLTAVLIAASCTTSTIPGTTVTAHGFVTYTESVDGVPTVTESTTATFTSEAPPPVGQSSFTTFFYMQPHDPIAGQSGTWKLKLHMDTVGLGTDTTYWTATMAAWPPDRSYELDGFNPGVVWQVHPECNTTDGIFTWVTERDIDAHTHAQLSVVRC